MTLQQRWLWVLTFGLSACGAPTEGSLVAPPTSHDVATAHEARSTASDADAGAAPGPSADEPDDATGADGVEHGGRDVPDPSPADDGESCGTFAGEAGAPYPAAQGSFLELVHDGLTRSYKVYVPGTYRNDAPIPVLYILHGYPGEAELLAFEGTDLDAAAEAHGFLLVVPSGYESSWNAETCCGKAIQEGVDDVGFLREVQRRLTSELGLCIDPSRVYAAGYSNGAFLTYRLACEASDMFAALASVGGKLASGAELCAASFDRPVPLLEIHGTRDWIAPIEGTREDVATIARLSGCADTKSPASVPFAELDTACETYEGCDGGAEVTLCVTEKKGHCWYGSDTCGSGKKLSTVLASNAEGIDANDALWEFVSRFRCEGCAP